MPTNAPKYTTYEGVSKIVPVDTVRLIRPLTENDAPNIPGALKSHRFFSRW